MSKAQQHTELCSRRAARQWERGFQAEPRRGRGAGWRHPPFSCYIGGQSSCSPVFLSAVSLRGSETAFGVSHFSALNRSCKWFRKPSCLPPWEGVGQCWGGGWEAGPSVHGPLCARSDGPRPSVHRALGRWLRLLGGSWVLSRAECVVHSPRLHLASRCAKLKHSIYPNLTRNQRISQVIILSLLGFLLLKRMLSTQHWVNILEVHHVPENTWF